MSTNESKFTPAPWEAHPYGMRGDEGPNDFLIVGSDGHDVALVYGFDAVAGANAALIDTAPELLELARRIRWLLAQKPYPGRDRDERAILAEAEAVIDKAGAS